MQLVPEPLPVPGETGTVEQLFLASGVRHLDGADRLADRVTPGDELAIQPQPDNPEDARALLLDAHDGHPVGWIPSYLLGEVHKWFEGGTTVRCFAERVNGPDAPSHMRLLCRLRASD